MTISKYLLKIKQVKKLFELK